MLTTRRTPKALRMAFAIRFSLAVALFTGLASLPSISHAQDWGQTAAISTTMGVQADRLCVGEASRGDLGCPTYAPFISSTSGYVGIGTNAPTAPLHVSGTGQLIRLTGGGSGDDLPYTNYLSSYDSAGTLIWYIGDASSALRRVLVTARGSAVAPYALDFETASNTRMHLTPEGPIAIGPSVHALTPSTSLQIAGTIRLGTETSTTLQTCDTDRTGAIKYQSGDFFICRNGTAWESFTSLVDGSSSAADRIISGTTQVITKTNTSVSIVTAGTERVVVGTQGSVGIGQQPVTGVALTTSGTSYFNGNVGIGTSAPTGPLHVMTSSTAPFKLGNSGGIYTLNMYINANGTSNITAPGSLNTLFNNINSSYTVGTSGGNIFSVQSSGTVIASGTLKIADSNETCSATNLGAMRYTANDFSVCRNAVTGWETVTAGTAIGASTFASLTDVSYSIATNNLFGPSSIAGITSSVTASTAYGIGALWGASNTNIGHSNSAFGNSTLSNNTSGNWNTALGRSSLNNNTTGSNNTAVGLSALLSNLSGSNNAALGARSLYTNTSGGNNVALGTNSLYSNNSATGSVAVGYNALYFNTSGYLTAVGTSALYNNTTGFSNAALATNALFSNTTGNYNTAFGNNSQVSNTTGSNNSAFGDNSLHYNNGGSFNAVLGANAGAGSVAGSTFTANSLVGSYAGYILTTGSSNTLLGYNAGSGITTGNNNLALGANTTPYSNTGSYQLNIANAIWGDFGSSTGNTNKIGINVTSPTTALEVSGTVSATRFVGDGSGLTNLPTASTATDRISTTGVASGVQLGMVVADRGTVSFTLGGTAGAAYLHPTLGLVAPGVSTTGNISTTTLMASGRATFKGGLLLNQGATGMDNLIYAGSATSGAVNASLGMFVAGVGSTHANQGPYFIGRGNTFNDLANQRGNLLLVAGNPTTPNSMEGSIQFLTASEVPRMIINSIGNVGIATTDPSSALHVKGTVTIGDDGGLCITTRLGAIKYVSNSFYICQNTSNGWENIATNGASSLSDRITSNSQAGVIANSNGYISLTTGGVTGTAYFTPASVLVNAGISTTGPISATRFFAANNGTESTPGYSFVGETDTGMYRPTTGALAFTTQTREVMRITSNGLVGINTSNPRNSFDVRGGGYFGDGTNANIAGAMLNVDGGILMFGDNDINMYQGGVSTRYTRSGITSNLGSVASFSITGSNGAWLAVNKTTPTTALDVSGSIRISNETQTCDSTIAGAIRYNTSTFQFCNGTGWASLLSTSSTLAATDRIISGTTQAIAYNNTSLSLVTAGTERMVIGTSGALGIAQQPIAGAVLAVSGNLSVTGRLGVVTPAGSNVMVGYTAGSANTGTNNTGLGHTTLASNSGSFNVAVGQYAMQNNTASGGVAVGYVAGLGNTGIGFTGVGYSAGQTNTGTYTSLFGANAGQYNSGNNLTAVGSNAAQSNTAVNVSAFGDIAAQLNTGSNIAAFGAQAASFNTGNNLTATGFQAAYNNTGNYVTAVGYQSARQNAGAYTTAVGYNAAFYNGSGTDNTALGSYSLLYNTTGSSNVAVGRSAGAGVASATAFTGSTLLGAYSGQGLTTGSSNTLLGYNAGGGITTGANNLVIGTNTSPNSNTGSNQLAIANAIWGNIGSGLGHANLIGINVPSPTTALQVSGTVTATRFVGDGSLLTGLATGSTDRITSGTTGMYTYNNASATIATAGTERLVVAPTGEVGIAQQSEAGFALSVSGSTKIRGRLNLMTPTLDSTLIGAFAGSNNSGPNITAVGLSTGQNNTGGYITLYGEFAGQNNTGNNILAMGYSAARYNSAGDIVAIGNSAAANNTGLGTIGVGFAAAANNSGNAGVVAMGVEAARYNSQPYTVAIGEQAGKGVSGTSTYQGTTLVGGFAGTNLTTGNNNTALGYTTLTSTTSGGANTAIGSSALTANTTGYNNTAVGMQSLTKNTTGSSNAGFGNYAGQALTSGSSNTLIGYNAGGGISTGSNNLVIGHQTTPYSNTGSFQLNVANAIWGNIGSGTGHANLIGINVTSPTTALEVSGTIAATRFVGDGSGLTGIGGSSDRITSGTTGMYAYNNTSATIATNGVERFVVGTDGTVGIAQQPNPSFTLSISGSVSIGNNGYLSIGVAGPAGNVALGNGAILPVVGGPNGQARTAVGVNAGVSATGRMLVAIGNGAGSYNSAAYSTLIGSSSGSNNTGTYATFVGALTGISNSGTLNTAMGYNAGNNGGSAISGNYATILGANSGKNNTFNNISLLGYATDATKDNQIVLGNSSTLEVTTTGVILAGGLNTAGIVTATYFEGDGSRLTNIGGSSDKIISGTTGMYAYNNTSATIATAGIERMVIGTTGEVGIGQQPQANFALSTSGTIQATSFQTALVSTRTNDGRIAFFTTSTTTDTTGLGIYAYSYDNATAYLRDTAMLYTGTDTSNLQLSAVSTTGSIRFNVGGYNSTASEHMRITAAGTIGISTTAPSTTLDIRGTIRMADGGESCDTNRLGAIKYSGGSFYVCKTAGAWDVMTTSGAGTAADRITSGTTSVIAYSNTSATISTAGVERLIVGTNGNVGIGQQPATGMSLAVSGTSSFNGDITHTGDIYGTSDARLKTAIQPIESAMATLSRLRPVSFQFRNKLGHTEYGFIAQEVQKLYPNLVNTAADTSGTLSVNYTGLIAPMVQGIQQLDTRTEGLQSDVTKLKTENAQLRAELDTIRAEVRALAKQQSPNAAIRN